MGLHASDIVAIEQPVQLLGGERNQFVNALARPVEAGFFQALLPQAEATAFPVEHLDTVSTSVAEHKEMLGERVEAETVLNQHRQAVDTLAEVDGIPAQIDHRQVIRWPHHGSAATVRSTVSRLLRFTSPLNPTVAPLGNWTCHWALPMPSTTVAF